MTFTIVILLGGLAALLAGGELLVRGAVALAERAGVTPLVIGLVIVGFGTSTPELVTSLEAVLAGSPAIAWGNIVGSNIANGLLILGAVALIAPMALRGRSAARDTGVALIAALVLFGIALAGMSGWWIGLAMLLALAAYIALCYREERVSAPEIVHNAPHDRAEALELTDAHLHAPRGGWVRPFVLTLAGLALLIAGGRFLVSGAIDLARLAGLSETVIGLTVVALGTSLPELVTSLVAARKGEAEVAFGSIVGSNIYNILGIGGMTMLAAPGAIPADLLPVDLGIVVASGVAIFVLGTFTGRIGRLAGLVSLGGYFGYLALLAAA